MKVIFGVTTRHPFFMIKRILSSNLFIFSSVSIAFALLYLLTTSLRLTWANFGNDGGDFLAAILTAGIPHPTGYPTYTVLGILFQQVPVGDEYSRVVMLSWLPAALSAGLLSLWILDFMKSNPKTTAIMCAVFGGLIWGLLPFLWSQAVIVEVHGLQALFLVLSIWWVWLLLNYHPQSKSRYYFYPMAFLYGLAIGNHITILFTLPIIVFSLFHAFKKQLPLKSLFYQIFAFILGSMIYLYLPLRAVNYPPINWGNPQTWEGFFWMVSGGAYQNLLAGVSLPQFFTRISALASILLNQFGVIGIIFGVIGAVNYQHKSKIFSVGLLYLILISSLFAILYATDDSINYLLTAFLVFTLWIVFAIELILPLTYKNIPLGKILIIIFFIFFLVRIPSNFKDINPRNQTQPADYAENLLTNLPEDSILLTSSDPDTFPVWYYHFGLGWREDLRIIVLPLTQYQWYQETLTHTYPDITYPPMISQFSNNNQNWGEAIPLLNQNRIICRSTITKPEDNLISVQCSDNQNFQFPIAD